MNLLIHERGVSPFTSFFYYFSQQCSIVFSIQVLTHLSDLSLSITYFNCLRRTSISNCLLLVCRNTIYSYIYLVSCNLSILSSSKYFSFVDCYIDDNVIWQKKAALFLSLKCGYLSLLSVAFLHWLQYLAQCWTNAVRSVHSWLVPDTRGKHSVFHL